MRLHILVDDELVAELDRRVGSRQRSAYLTQLLRRALDDERRWDDIEASLASVEEGPHDWDDNPADWVRSQRRAAGERVG